MENHITDEQISGYWKRQSPPDELLATDHHLADCASCRQRVAEAMDIDKWFSALKAGLVKGGAAEEEEHLSYEQLMAYAEGKLGEVDRDIVASHLDVCKLCGDEAQDLKSFWYSISDSCDVPYVPPVPARLPLSERLRPLWRRRATRHALAFAALAALVLIASWAAMRPLRIEVAELRGQLEGPRQVLLYPVPIAGDFPQGSSVEAQIQAINESTGDKLNRTVYSRVPNDNTYPPVIAFETAPRALVALELIVREGPLSRPRRYVGLTRLFPTQHSLVIRVAPVDLASRNVFAASVFRAYSQFSRFVSGSSSAEIEQAVETGEHGKWLKLTAQTVDASINFFDDVKVYAGRKVFADEDFDSYPEGRRSVAGFRPVWWGKDGYVTRATHAPRSGPGCWASESYPNWSRQDAISIDPADVPRGAKLTFEASLCVPDPGKGVRVGLTQPIASEQGRGEPYVSQRTIAVFVLRDGELLLHRAPEVGAPQEPASHSGEPLLSYEPDVWHRLKVECDVQKSTMDICLDGRWVRGRKMTAPLGRGVVQFSIGGAYFAEAEL
jgi:anti-sigma factor RsiW